MFSEQNLLIIRRALDTLIQNDDRADLQYHELEQARQARAEVKASREEMEKAIMYELNNYEAFYSGELDDTVDALAGLYTREQIKKVYSKHRRTTWERERANESIVA